MQFEDLLAAALRTEQRDLPAPLPGHSRSGDERHRRSCMAETLDYGREVEIKEGLLREFWKSKGLPGSPEPLLRSPLGRGYRTVTKRKAFPGNGSIELALIDSDETGRLEPCVVSSCAIEAAGHAGIYRAIQDALGKPYAHALAGRLSYAVIKGNYREFTLILNVREISGKVISAANTLSKSLTRAFPSIVGVFLYLDETGGRYYLGVKNPGARPTLKKLFGKSMIFLKACGKTFLYSPLSFSQVNESMVDPLVGKVGELLALTRASRLYDLYCGYGLFALCLAPEAGSVTGVEISQDSVQSAIENAARQKASRVRFLRSDITPDTIAPLLRQMQPSDRVLLDPPRGGTSEGVIETIASLGPERVVHLFCNIGVMPAEITRWLSSGYTLARAVPLDMFPGTAAVETAVLFERTSGVKKET